MASSDGDAPSMDVAAARARLRAAIMSLMSREGRGLLADSQIVTGVTNAVTDILLAGDFEESGPLPASKAAIDAMPRTIVTEEEQAKDCSICLDEIGVGGEVTEMPCKHGFHSNCIEKWLKLRGSCPVCRFLMPVDDDGGDNSESVEDSEVGSDDSTVDAS